MIPHILDTISEYIKMVNNNYQNNYKNVNNNPYDWGLVHYTLPVSCNANMCRRWRSGDKTCLICLNKIEKGTKKVGNMACGHVVHLMCLKKWYDKGSHIVEVEPGLRVRFGKTCPMCRKVYRVFHVNAVKIED